MGGNTMGANTVGANTAGPCTVGGVEGKSRARESGVVGGATEAVGGGVGEGRGGGLRGDSGVLMAVVQRC